MEIQCTRQQSVTIILKLANVFSIKCSNKSTKHWNEIYSQKRIFEAIVP